VTSRYYGRSDELLEKYAWYSKNSANRTWPVGRLKPNDLGLFDMHGQVCIWCQDRDKVRERYRATGRAWAGKPLEEIEEITLTGTARVLRGDAFYRQPGSVRAAERDWKVPGEYHYFLGFRLARTFR
jgi:formylglycine-generating enzyme required for sulfatase activity